MVFLQRKLRPQSLTRTIPAAPKNFQLPDLIRTCLAGIIDNDPLRSAGCPGQAAQVARLWYLCQPKSPVSRSGWEDLQIRRNPCAYVLMWGRLKGRPTFHKSAGLEK